MRGLKPASPTPMMNLQAYAPPKFWTAAKQVAAIPHTKAHVASNLAIRVRLPRRANGTTDLRQNGWIEVRVPLTEWGIANVV